MSSWIIALSAGATSAPGTGYFQPATIPEWLQIGLAVIGVGAVVGISVAVSAIRDLMPKPAEHPDKEFARMMCDRIWVHTDAMTGVFAQRLRQEPSDLATLRLLIAHLREDLAGSVQFVEQMRGQPSSAWPHKYGLLGAFDGWAGQVKSMETQVENLQRAVTSPKEVAEGKDREAAEKYRDAMLIYHYLTDRTVLSRGVGQMKGHASAICAAARKSLEKDKDKERRAFAFPRSKDEDEGGDHHGCPCCRRGGDHVTVIQPDPLHLPPLPPAPPRPPSPPPPPPPSPPPPAQQLICYCAVPQPCRCARPCGCNCVCVQHPATPAPPKPAG